jgi:ceramide glucosyltransferase
MASAPSLFLWMLATTGLLLFAAQAAVAVWHLSQAPKAPSGYPPISILKPLCGVDDRLWHNLESFAQLDYPSYEVLLGVEHTADPAYVVACRAAARWPSLMRVVLQRGAPGLNPKVNQLITLAGRARHGLLVVSDSNVMVRADYLDEIAAELEDPAVGLVTHPIAGAGEESLGSLLDNLHLSVSIGPGLIAVNVVGRSPLVVGKSMAFRRAELEAIGGFESLKDVLAEDYVMGRRVAAVCGKRVAVAHRPVTNVSCRRTLRAFFDRYARWNVLQRTAVGPALYSAGLLLNPTLFALAALLLAPSRPALAALLACAVLKAGLECWVSRALRGSGFSLRVVAAMPCKDLLLLATWLLGLARSEVRWRGRRLAVLEGTRLAPIAAAAGGLLSRRPEPAASRAS